MTGTAEPLRAFLDAHPACALVEVVEAKGSTPREQGAWMLVAPGAIFGTIGGGQLEWMAIDEARRRLRRTMETPGRPPATVLRDGSNEQDAPQRRGSPTPSRFAIHLSPLRRERKGAEPAGLGLSSPSGGGRGGSAEPRRSGGTTLMQPLDPPAGAERGADAWESFLDIPLGPEIGQCCGGRVKLGIRPIDDELRDTLLSEAQIQDAARPHVLVFGAGHVGRALAAALALLPVRATVVETREHPLEGLEGATLLTPVPEEAVRAAPAGSAFVILTHDHALDFLLAAEALGRGDAAYVGMIGSKTKRAAFRRWFLSEAGGAEAAFDRLVCPIGSGASHDKRPAVIAALVAAEIVSVLFQGMRSRSR